MVLASDYPFLDVLWTMLVFFAWVIWFWLLITVFADLFRRHDISGWGKAGWIVLCVILPYLGVLIYLIAEGKGMAERLEMGAFHPGGVQWPSNTAEPSRLVSLLSSQKSNAGRVSISPSVRAETARPNGRGASCASTSSAHTI